MEIYTNLNHPDFFSPFLFMNTKIIILIIYYDENLDQYFSYQGVKEYSWNDSPEMLWVKLFFNKLWPFVALKLYYLYQICAFYFLLPKYSCFFFNS